MRCPHCGFPVSDDASICPKCDLDLITERAKKPLVVDVAHHGETVSSALAKLDQAVSQCLWDGHPSLKVIHGHGASTGHSALKPHILSALQKHAARLRGTVSPVPGNPGMHILHFR